MLSKALTTAAAGSAGGDYQISRSLRFNSADSAYLSRTPASAGNRKTFTWSGWVKRSGLGSGTTFYNLFEAYAGASDTDAFGLRFDSNDNLQAWGYNSSWRVTNAVYRDLSAWYHIVIAVDTTQATANDRIKLYINGIQVTAFSTTNNPALDANTGVNSTGAHYIGRAGYAALWYFSGYLTDINFIDGQALTPSSFGETNETTGVWSPIRYGGSYGTNGFYLNFSDNSGVTAATLGADSSGNGNNWTPNNFSVTAGAGNDSLVDTPTPYGTDTGAGGEVRGNYATLNPLVALSGTRTFTNGNLDLAVATTNVNTFATFALPTTGKWYWEYQVTASAGIPMGGVLAGFISDIATGVVYLANGEKYVNNINSSYGASYTTTDIIGVAVDVDGGTITFYKNGSSQGAITASVGGLFPIVRSNSISDTFVFNFGQRPFAHPLSGFKALVTTNLPEPTVVQGDDYFNTVLYDGNGTSQSITGVGFQPDFVWIKNKSAAYGHRLVDIIRGTTKELFSNSTDAESTDVNGLTAFGSDGFTVGSSIAYNGSGNAIVAWNWKANGAGVSNTDGTITSTVSANTTAGISIVTYTGNGTAGATVGHGLGVAPNWYFIKQRNGSTYGWVVYHSAVGADKYLLLNATNAATTDTLMWNNTAPTSNVFSLSSGGNVAVTNPNTGTMVAYCFAEVEGFSKFGSYTGNGSADGPFIFTGFRPAFILIKCSSTSSGTGTWWVNDSKRSTYNAVDNRLSWDSSAAEQTGISQYDFLSNGFKIRDSNAAWNGSGNTYIYACFAENPFKYSLAR